MMKNIFSISVVLLSITLFSQNSPMSFSEVVTVEKAEKQALLTRAKMFFESKKYDLKVEGDQLKGIGKFVLEYPSVVKGKMERGEVHYDIVIACKDGRYKYELTKFRHVGINGKSNGGPLELPDAECGRAQIAAGSWAKIKTDTQEEVKKILSSLQNNMIEISKAAEKDNW
ncbi:MAG: DUF4468 domain-containing protein [Cytophagales bacterium]